MTGKASMATIGEYARRCAPFSQALTPQFVVQRMVHLLQEPPPGSLSAGQEAVPEDELQQSVMLYRRMSGDELPKEWDMILQVFLLRLLALNYTRRWGGLSDAIRCDPTNAPCICLLSVVFMLMSPLSLRLA